MLRRASAPLFLAKGGKIVNGQIIAQTLANIGELHDGSSFTGTLSGVFGTPKPGTWLLLGGGLLALKVFGRRLVTLRSRAKR